MWIRSQDEEILLDCAWIVKSPRVYVIRGGLTGVENGWELGRYKTGDRCIEVLDSMHAWIDEQTKIKCISKVVYQMPKE